MNEIAGMSRMLILFIAFLAAQTSRAQMSPETTTTRNGRYHFNSEYTRVTGKVRKHTFHGKFVTKQRYEYGKWRITEIKHFWYGELNGQYTSLSMEGDTLSSGNYHHNKKNGAWRYFEHGKLKRSEYYDAQGHLSGWSYDYYADGVLNAKTLHTDSTHEYLWMYNHNGMISARGSYVNKMADGTFYAYSNIDSIRSPTDTLPSTISEWKAGRLHGSEKKFVNGILKEEHHYYEGQFDGVQRWYTNNVPYQESNYKRGRLHGPQRTFFKNGTIEFETVYDENSVTQKHQFDSASGKIVSSYWFTENRPDSTFHYAESGQLIYARKIVNETTGEYEERRYYENGMRKDSARSVGFSLRGEVHSWYANGNTKNIAHYDEHGLCGPYDAWSENGVHVVHAEVARRYDTIPELVWSDKGQRLQRGTVAYTKQLDLYLHNGVRYNDSIFRLHPFVVTAFVAMPGDHWISKAQAVQIGSGDNVSTNKRVAPKFPGGDSAFYVWMKTNIRYPDLAREMGVQGSDWISFVVNTDSTISDVVLLHPVAGAPDLDVEALRVIRNMPKWSPAKKGGKPFKSTCVIEIRWVLKTEN